MKGPEGGIHTDTDEVRWRYEASEGMRNLIPSLLLWSPGLGLTDREMADYLRWSVVREARRRKAMTGVDRRA
jgi:hypothetical protein